MLLECVANFSEGREPGRIAHIERAITAVTDIRFLGSDPSYDANRVVMTFAGPPRAVIEAAFRGIRAAGDVIDMRVHQGAHPRIGAADVCPLVPLSGMSLAQALPFANELARRVGVSLEIPVFLYGAAATRPERRGLAAIRAGQYEGLRAKLADPQWIPDYGPASLNARSGATAIGVRPILIAYNINLEGNALTQARAIAARIRESGRRVHGQIVAGKFKGLQAIGWHLPRLGLTQVSTNILDPETAPPHLVFDTVREMAEQAGTRVLGSELVGLAPRAVIEAAGRYFCGARIAGHTPDDLVEIAAQRLGLRSIKPFDPTRHLLEDALAGPIA